jgi:signal transduction histidine kinase/DNA-binding response OmpR family regulator
MSLRTRILLLVSVATLVPALVLAAYFFAERDRNVTATKRGLAVIARGAAANLEERAGDLAHDLFLLSHAHELNSGDPAACSEFLARMIKEFPAYSGLYTFTPEGELRCDATRADRRLNVVDRRYFRQALAGEGPAFQVVVSRFTGIATIAIARAIRDVLGRAGDVLVTSFPLNQLAAEVRNHQPYVNAVVRIWGENGVVLVNEQRGGDPEKRVGRAYPDSELYRWLRTASDGDTVELPNLLGVPHLWAVARTPQSWGSDLSITIGVPLEELTAEAGQALRRALAVLALTALAVFASAYALAEQGIRRSVVRISDAVTRFRAGDLATRIPPPFPKGELGELMAALNVTADWLQAQNEEIRRLNQDLERRVIERTADLAQANARLEAANRLKSEFLASMSHELRTPLNAIIGFSEVLKDGLVGDLNAEQKQFAADILASGTHLLSLINDILDLSKVEAGMMQLEPEPLRIEPLLASALTVVKEKAAKQKVTLDLKVEPALPAIHADARKLKQIAFNLVSNAVKFTPEGGRVTIAARCVPRDAVAFQGTVPARVLPLPEGNDAHFIEISVRDTGIGIEEKDLGRLFEPFVQIDSSLARSQPGTGLGLALIRRLAELHGGTAGVASRPGEGSTFAVWIPLRTADVTPAALLPPRPAPELQPEQLAPATPSVRSALVVEDDDAAARLLTNQLRAEGFEVMRAATAEEGLVRAAKSRPKLITLDIFLPQMDGWEFLRRVRSDPELACIPVVIVSVSRDAEHGLALGATRVLQKPFVRDELARALAGLVPRDPDGKHARVLVVDDNPRAIELLETYLRELPVDVLRAYSGSEAVRTARCGRPDLVVLDLLMPDMNGFEVVEALKAEPETAAIPVLVVTAKDLTPGDIQRLNGNVLSIVGKSQFDAARFRAEVHRALADEAGNGR